MTAAAHTHRSRDKATMLFFQPGWIRRMVAEAEMH
jgi:hypothetical protein